MSSVTTFGAFTMARLGIYASQKRLDATGNNIANINTEGYTRQTIKQKALVLGGADRTHSVNDSKIGYGTMVTGSAQIRDPYLDIRYRNEQSSVGAMEAKQYGLNEIASVLDEVGGGEDGEGVMEAQFNDLMQTMQHLVTQGAGRDEADTLVREAASSIVNTFHEYSSRLETLKKNQETMFRGDIGRVNRILENIAELNSSIRKSNIYGADALEQKDERNLLIDELSKYMKIKVTTEKEELGAGLIVDKLVIKLNNDDGIFAHTATNNATLVDGVYSTRLSIRQTPVVENGKYTDLDGNPIEDVKAGGDNSAVKYDKESGTSYVFENEQVPIKLKDNTTMPEPVTEERYIDINGNILEETPTINPNGSATIPKKVYLKPYADGTPVQEQHYYRADNGEPLLNVGTGYYTTEENQSGGLDYYVKVDGEKVKLQMDGSNPKVSDFYVTDDGKVTEKETDKYTVEYDGDGKPYFTVTENVTLQANTPQKVYVDKNDPSVLVAPVAGNNYHYDKNGDAYVTVDGKDIQIKMTGNLPGAGQADKDDEGNFIRKDGSSIDKNAVQDDGTIYYKDDGTPYLLVQTEKKIPIATEDSPNFDIDFAELKDLKGNVLEDTYMQRVGANVDPTMLKDEEGNSIGNDDAEAIAKAYVRANKLPVEDITLNDGKHETYKYEAVPNTSGGVIKSWDIICTKTVTSEKVELYDNSLYGSLQAERELLTEQGEYSTAEQIQKDTNATAKFGYPYYQHTLDSLANKFAEMMNDANKTVPDATLTYETINGDQYYSLPSEDELLDRISKLTDKNGNPITKKDENGKEVHIYSIADLGLKDSEGTPITTYNQLKAEMKVGEHLTENQQKVLMPEEDGGYFLGAYGEVKGGNLFSNNFNGNESNDPKITAGNISISSQWFKGEVRIITSTEFNSGSTANDNLSHILSQYMNGEFEFKAGDVYPDAASYPYVVDEKGEPIQTGVDKDGNPVYQLKEGYDEEDVANYEASSFYKGSFQGMLMNMWEIMANDQKTTDEMLTNYNTSADELYVNRDAVMGVDLNDEAMNMMQYQKSYSAACRFMTTIDELLDKLINGTGRAGL